MAVLFGTAGDFYDYTTDGPSVAAQTLTAWVYTTGTAGTAQDIIRVRTSADGTCLALKLYATGSTIRITGPGTPMDSAATVPTGTWWRVAYTVAGTAATIFSQNGSGAGAVATTSGTIDQGTPAKFAIGGRGAADNTEPFAG